VSGFTRFAELAICRCGVRSWTTLSIVSSNPSSSLGSMLVDEVSRLVLSGSFSTLGSAGLMSAFDRPDVLPLMDGIEVHFVQKPGNCNRL
jgi:hypothetical protein